EEAIKLLANIASDIEVGEEDDDLDALKLGIEALKKVKKQRERSDFHGIPPLPGETKED
ncbi:hypothetical protein LCGC14_2650900, partial [marine sediment metagenome]